MGSILVLGGVGFTVKEVVETARKVTEHPIPAKEEHVEQEIHLC